MQVMDQQLSHLIAQGSKDGFLSFDAVSAYLPDEDVYPEKLEALLLAIEAHGIELVEAPAAGTAGSPALTVRFLFASTSTSTPLVPPRIVALIEFQPVFQT